MVNNEITKITPEEFANCFRDIDVGNANSALFIINDKLEKQAKSFTGDLITPLFIKDKYDEYSRWWKGKFGKNDPKYVSAKDKKMTLYDFLMQGGYNNSYTREDQPRDSYLFGNIPRDVLITKTKEFIKDAKTRKEKRI